MPVLALPSFAKGEISPSLYGRVDTNLYKAGLRTARNAIIHNYGGVSNRPGTLCIGPTKSHTTALQPRFHRFHLGTSDQYVLEFGNLYLRFVRNDEWVLETAVTITAATVADPVVVTATAHGYSNGDDVRITGVVGMTQLNKRRFIVRNVATNTFELESQVTGVAVDGTGYTAYTSGGAVGKVYEIPTTYVQADLRRLKLVQTGNVITITHTGYAPRDLTRTDHDAWTLTTNTYAPGIDAPTDALDGSDIVPSFDDNFQVFTEGGLTVNYQVTAISDTDGRFEESLPLTMTTTDGSDPPLNTLTWDVDLPADADRYAVYRQDNGLYGLLGETELNSFEDKNLGTDLTISPPSARNPFSSLFPMASGYYQQRQVYGGTTSEPDKSWYSQTGLRLNMSVSVPLQPADSITASLASQDVQEIRHYVPIGKDLLIMTNSGEWRVNSGPDSGFSQDTIKQEPETNWGSSHDAPIVVGKSILFVEDGGGRVRSLGFQLEVDGFDTNDLTVVANHLLAEKSADEFTVLDWTFGQFPEPRVYIVRSDGKALTMTFDTEQQVIAWTTWDTRGKFFSATSLRRSVESIEDGIYFGVQRKTSLGGDANFLERLHTRKFADVRDGFFVDGGFKHDNKTNITNITDADPAVFTAAAHGLSDGDEVEIADIDWFQDIADVCSDETPSQFNNFRHVIANKTTNTFQLFSHVAESGGGFDITTIPCPADIEVVLTEPTTGGRMMVSDDGLKMFAMDSSPANQKIYEYALTEAYDVGTLVQPAQATLSVASPGSFGLTHAEFNPDGTKLGTQRGSSGFVTYENYNLSTGFDLTSAVLGDASSNTYPVGLGSWKWNLDGTTVFYLEQVLGSEIFTFPLDIVGGATAYDITGPRLPFTSRIQVENLGGEVSINPGDFSFNDAHTKLFVHGGRTDAVYLIEIGTADDLDTITYTDTKKDDCSSKMHSEVWRPGGLRRYMMESVNATGDPEIHQWDLPGTAGGDIGLPSTEVYNRGGQVRLLVSEITDLWCLEGLEVKLFLDGNVEANQTVADGKITVADARKIARGMVGRPYTTDIELLDIEAGTKPTTLQGKLKKISKVTVRFHKSRMPQVGPRSDLLTQMRPRNFEKYGEASALVSGDEVVNIKPSWNSNGRIFFRQCDPVPLTIVAVFPDVGTEDELE